MDDSASYNWLFILSYDVLAAKYRKQNPVFEEKCECLYFAKYNPTPHTYCLLNIGKKIFKTKPNPATLIVAKDFRVVRNPQVELSYSLTALYVG